METKLEQIAVKAVNQLPKSVVREIRTPRSVGAAKVRLHILRSPSVNSKGVEHSARRHSETPTGTLRWMAAGLEQDPAPACGGASTAGQIEGWGVEPFRARSRAWRRRIGLPWDQKCSITTLIRDAAKVLSSKLIGTPLLSRLTLVHASRGAPRGTFRSSDSSPTGRRAAIRVACRA